MRLTTYVCNGFLRCPLSHWCSTASFFVFFVCVYVSCRVELHMADAHGAVSRTVPSERSLLLLSPTFRMTHRYVHHRLLGKREKHLVKDLVLFLAVLPSCSEEETLLATPEHQVCTPHPSSSSLSPSFLHLLSIFFFLFILLSFLFFLSVCPFAASLVCFCL